MKNLSNDMIILVSDGVPEAINEQKEIFGFERLNEAIEAFPHNHLAGKDFPEFDNLSGLMVEHLKRQVLAFVGEAEPHDDLTIVVVEI